MYVTATEATWLRGAIKEPRRTMLGLDDYTARMIEDIVERFAVWREAGPVWAAKAMLLTVNEIKAVYACHLALLTEPKSGRWHEEAPWAIYALYKRQLAVAATRRGRLSPLAI
jgi:hypothetical protein